MKVRLELLAEAGAAPEAVLAEAKARRVEDLARGMAGRLLGARASYDAVLSFDWGCLVFCTPEFSAWWRPRAFERRPAGGIFLEVWTA